MATLDSRTYPRLSSLPAVASRKSQNACFVAWQVVRADGWEESKAVRPMGVERQKVRTTKKREGWRGGS